MKHRKTIEQDVINFIKKYNLLKDSKRILITLSGGADSVFALHFFNKYSRKFKVEIFTVHVNHNLRGNESLRDEKFSKELCSKLNYPISIVNVDVKNFAVNNKKSIEEAARELRYAAFEREAELVNADLIVTAHNKDDNTETVLLNLFNGTGISGLSGIPVKRSKYIRPFLSVSKNDIKEYLRYHKLNFVEDSSNQNVDFTRNFIRKNIVPSVKENINPALDKAILQSSEILRNQGRIIDFFVNRITDEVCRKSEGQVILLVEKLKSYPSEIYGEVLKKIIAINFSEEFNFIKLESIKNLLDAQTGTEINLGKNIFAWKDRGEIIISKRKEDFNIDIFFDVGQNVKFGENKILSEYIETMPKTIKKIGNTEYLSADKFKGKLNLRCWKKGDKIRLLGMKETKKVSDVLTDLKIPVYERKRQLVLLNMNEIIWLVGRRISENYKITKSTKKIVKLCLQ